MYCGWAALSGLMTRCFIVFVAVIIHQSDQSRTELHLLMALSAGEAPGCRSSSGMMDH